MGRPEHQLVDANTIATEKCATISPKISVSVSDEMLLPDRYQTHHPKHCLAFNASPDVRPMGQKFKCYVQRNEGTEFSIEINLPP